MVSERANESDLVGSESAARVESGSQGSVAPDLMGTAAPESGISRTPNTEPGEEPPPNVHAPVPPVAAAAPKSSLWPDRLSAAAASFYEWLSRPRVRLTATGVILLLIGGLLMSSSVWTLPLVIVGALMVVTAWIGCRLDGRFAVEWGDTGTQLEFRAKIRAAEPARPELDRTYSSSQQLLRSSQRESKDAEIIEGEAHTVEIDVAELKALIAAVETTEAALAQTDASVQATRNLRVAHGGGRSSEGMR